MKGGNTDSKTGDVQGFDYDGVERYGSVDMTGGKKGQKGNKGKKSKKIYEFDFEKEWKEFEMSYNQKYGGAKKRKTSSTKKAPAKKTSSTKKKPKRKTRQRGGDEAGATYAPAQFFDANATMSAPSSGQSKGSLVDGLYPYSPNNPVVGQTGGAKKKKDSKTKKPKTATKTTKPKKDTKKKDSKKDAKKDSKKKDTKSTVNKVSVLDKIKKFFAM